MAEIIRESMPVNTEDIPLLIKTYKDVPACSVGGGVKKDRVTINENGVLLTTSCEGCCMQTYGEPKNKSLTS